MYNPYNYHQVMTEMFERGEYSRVLSGRDGFEHINSYDLAHDHLLVFGELFRWLGNDKDRHPAARGVQEVILMYIAQRDDRYLIMIINSWKAHFSDSSSGMSASLPVDWTIINRALCKYLLEKHAENQLSKRTFEIDIKGWPQIIPGLNTKPVIDHVESSPANMPDVTNYQEIL